MGYQINLGQWNQIFAVPCAVADRHLKLASEAQLKVLLYLLRRAGEDCPDSAVARAVGISADEVMNAVEFWTERGLLANSGFELTPASSAVSALAVSAAVDSSSNSVSAVPDHPADESPRVKRPTAISRAVRPDSAYVSALAERDRNFAGLTEEAQAAMGKLLAPGDTAVLAMLYDTFGLPCEVIAMLIHYLADSGRANMRAVERIGIEWSDKGIDTAEAAEHEIERMSASREAWGRVAALLGIRTAGHPTAAQLANADRWLNEWRFHDEMINEAYERCVNTKGEYNMSYINAILKKWYEKKIFSLDALKEAEQRTDRPRKKNSSKGGVFTSDGASFDMDVYESKSLFDD